MRLLFFQWHSFMNKGIERALKKLNIDYATYYYSFTDWEKDDNFLEKFAAQVLLCKCDTVLSVNFSPLISQVCEEKGLRYISWVYDNPLHIRDLAPLQNSCNEIYFFDREEAAAYRRLGVNAAHMPLAVDTEVFTVKPSAADRQRYSCDISMVGSLYQTEYAYYTAPMRPYVRGYLEGIINAQQKLPTGYILGDLITPELLNMMNEDYRKLPDSSFQMGNRELEYMLACEATGRDRYIALALLSAHYNVDLYSAKADSRLRAVHHKGYADYYTQMPAVFALSRINLNISLKIIRTGIPLRIIDIMGCGGFVLTNYQEELTEHFEPGRECVIYESIADLYAKASYYLAHEEERKAIALAGYEKVKRDFTFTERLKKML